MAKRRMFNVDIIESDVFLDMPLGTQALYFHLSMNADDYGFVSPKRVMRMVGANDDDLKILLMKRFILGFESGVVVIKHWPVNNTMRKDRSRPTTYDKEIKSLTYNEFGAYTEIKKMIKVVEDVEKATTNYTESTEVGNQTSTNWQPHDNQMPAQNRIEQNRIDKNRIIDTNVSMGVVEKKGKTEKTRAIDGMFTYWSSEVGYTITSKKKQNREYAGKLLNEYGKQDIALMIKAAALASEDQYAPGVSDFIDLYRKWDKLKLWGKKKGMKQHAVAQF